MTEHRRAVLVQRGAVQPHRSSQRPHHPRQRARQRGLAGRRRTGDTRRLPGMQAQRGLAHHSEPRPRRRDREVLRLQDRARRRQRCPHRLRWGLPQESPERAPCHHRPLQPRPVADRLIDGRKRPPQQDRPGDHHPRRQLPAQRQPRPQPQHHRLQEQAQRLGDHPVESVAVRGRQGLVEQPVAQPRRAGQNNVEHAETLHGLAAGTHLFDEVLGVGRRLPGLLLQAPRPRLVDERHHQQQAAGEHRQDAEHPVEGEQHEQEHRRPGRIEEGEGAVAGGETLDRFQIAQAGGRPGALRRHHRALQDRPQHARVEPRLQPRAGAGQHPPARMIEHAHEQEQERHQNGQRDQRRLRPRAQHAVVNLQHEQRAGEHQYVHRHAEQRARHEQPAALRERRPDLPVAGSVLRHQLVSLRFARTPPTAPTQARAPEASAKGTTPTATSSREAADR